MMEIEGACARAKIFSDSVDASSQGQIRAICDARLAEGMKIRIMPDFHPGAGCVIGFTAALAGKAAPKMVGVDIGCGMHCVNLGQIQPDFNQLDKVIRLNVPSGKGIRKKPHRFAERAELDRLSGKGSG